MTMSNRHIALYRKYRSQSFGDLVGQQHVVQTLQNAVSGGKIAQAYLFTGPRGTGKTSTARLLAKALNCTGGPSAEIPADCPICEEIAAGVCMDVIEMDAASESGVKEVREHIVEASEYQPASCRYKVFIIDEVHDLSSKAFDALLKTIEEPPPHVVFILATTEYHKVPPTIRSRCQRFEFHRGTVGDIVSRLQYIAEQEGFEAQVSALTAIARMADGGYRDALTLLEQAVVTANGTLTLEHVYNQLGLVPDEVIDSLLLAMADGQDSKTIEVLEGIYRTGRDPQAILESLLVRLSDLTRGVLHLDASPGSDAAVEAALSATGSRLGLEKIMVIRTAVTECFREGRDVSLPRIWLESQCLRIGRLAAGQSASKSVARAAVASVARVSTAHPEPPPSQPEPERPGQVSDEGPEAAGGPRIKAPAVPPEAAKSDAAVAWGFVVQEMCGQSKVAQTRLQNSFASIDESGLVTVTLGREGDVDWVMTKRAVEQAIRQYWEAATGKASEFRFVAGGKAGPTSPAVPLASVESALEGDRLVDVAKEVFGIETEAGADEKV